MIVRTATDGSVIWWCPGCNLPHRVTTQPPGPVWTWNGDRQFPTFTPSVLVTWDNPEPPHHVCHSFVKEGQMQFLGDCTHHLANQTVPIPDWPYAPNTFGGIQD